jgi:hypothetical protein
MGRVELGLQDVEFWNLTFHLFFILYERFSETQRREDIRAGVICAVLGNIHRNKKSRKVFEPGDFFPHLKAEKKEMTWQDQLGYIKQLQAMLSGMKKKG